MFKHTAALTAIACALAFGASAAHAADKPLKSIGVTVGSLGNPYFVTIVKGAEARAKQLNPNAKVTAVSADYDLNKQFTQIDNFISAHVDMILLNATDPKAIEPAVKKAQAAGITVVAIDVAAAGANATVQTNNVKAGELACDYIAKKLNGKGNVIIENGPQVSAVIDRVNGCKTVLAKNTGIKLLSSDQDGKGSREGGMNAMQGYLTRFPKLDAVFTI
ncbi:MAG: substrate-binding domain-containing protein, partial [Burkholderia sp.]|nr:substrate-binding domain-containing protein [Burkholderia sp.]